MLAELLAVLAPVYTCAGLGFAWRRTGRHYDTRLVTDLISSVGAPCLVFSALSTLDVDPDSLRRMGLATAAALATFGVAGALLLRLVNLPRTTYLAPLVWMNAGNMGLPVNLFAFGEEGLAYAVVFFAVAAISHFTVGTWVWTGRASLRELATTPLAWGAGAGAAVLATGVGVPAWVANTTSLLGDFTIPLMQFTLGVSLAELRPGRIPRNLGVSLARLGVGLGVGLLLARLFGLEGPARGVFVIDCAMPVAVFNYLMAERYGRSPGDVASTVVLSTLASFATLPFLLAWILG